MSAGSEKSEQYWMWAGFFVLCVLWASAWVVESAWPSSLPLGVRQCIDKFAIAAVLCGFGISRKCIRWERLGGAHWAKVGAASVCLLAVPALTLEATSGAVLQSMSESLFALVPVAVVVLAPYIGLSARSDGEPVGSESWRETSHLLLPALTGLAGLLLLLSFSLPESLREVGFDAIVLVAVGIVAVVSIWMYRLLGEFTLLEASIVYCMTNGMAFGVFLLVSSVGQAGWFESLVGNLTGKTLAVEVAKAILFELPQVLLLVWLLRAMAPARFAARYLVVPLMVVLEGYVLLWPGLTVRLICGFVLLVVGVWRLLTAEVPKGETFLMLP
jgi:hypothetical protein